MQLTIFPSFLWLRDFWLFCHRSIMEVGVELRLCLFAGVLEVVHSENSFLKQCSRPCIKNDNWQLSDYKSFFAFINGNGVFRLPILSSNTQLAAILSRGIPTSPLCRLKCTAGCRSTQDVVAGTPLQLGKSTGFHITPGCLNGWNKKCFLQTTRFFFKVFHWFTITITYFYYMGTYKPWFPSMCTLNPINQWDVSK